MNTRPATKRPATVEPLQLHPEVAADRTIRERLEAMDATRGFLFGAALSTILWLPIAAALATAHALS